MLKLAKYLKPFVFFMILAVSILFVQAFCDLTLPNLMAQLVNLILVEEAAQDSGDSNILRLGFQMLAIALIGGGAAVAVGFLSTWIAAGIARDLRYAVFEKVESFSSHEFDSFSTASLITRSTNDVNQVQGIFIMGIRMLCYAPVMGIGGIIMAVRTAPSMSWIIVLAVVLLIGMVAIFTSIIMPKFKIIQQLVDNLNRIGRETLNGLMVIRAFGAQR
jgi:ATP-binding cassette subfamily B protein